MRAMVSSYMFYKYLAKALPCVMNIGGRAMGDYYNGMYIIYL